jgi:arylsulfatase A-like enzyme
MKYIFIQFLLFIYCFQVAMDGLSQGKTRKTIFILVDGIPADVVEKVPTPVLDSLAKVGSYKRAYVGGEKDGYSQSPTISAVGYNSLLTGTWAHKHNVWDNDIKEPNYHYPTIFRLFKNQYPEKKIAIFSSWLDNRTKLIGEGLPATGNIKLDYHADGYELDTLQFPHDKARDFMLKIDNRVVEEATTHILKQAPDLSWVYLEYTDDMGHMYGDSEQFYEAVKKMDAQIGKITQAVNYRQKNYKEEWLIFITTDHGRDEQTGKDHGRQTFRQRSTWLVTNYPNLNTYAAYYTPGVVDIMPSIARFMNISLPLDISRELDGISLFGNVSLAGVEVHHFQNQLDITWKPLQREGQVKIWVCTSNAFKQGGKETYQLMDQVPLKRGQASIDVSNMPSDFYKIVVEGPANRVSKWYMPVDKQK